MNANALTTSNDSARRNGDGLTVFERAAARIRAVEESDKLIARQKEQIKELESQVARMEELRSQISAALLDNAATFHDAVHKYEALLITAALKQTKGSVTRAAAILGVSYQAVTYMLDHQHKALQHLHPKRKRGNKSTK